MAPPLDGKESAWELCFSRAPGPYPQVRWLNPLGTHPELPVSPDISLTGWSRLEQQLLEV